MNSKTQTIGIYHKDCSDGTMAAALLLQQFPHILLFPLGHSYSENELATVLDAVDDQTTVYVLDCAIGIESLVKKAKEVKIFDHHISEKEFLEKLTAIHNNLVFVFDNNRSSSSIVWSYFHKKPLPKLIAYIEDFDLRLWKFGEETKYITNVVYQSRNKPQEMLSYLKKDTSDLLHQGKIMSKLTDQYVDLFVKDRDKIGINIQIGKYKVKAFNTSFFHSEIGNLLTQKEDQAVAVFKIQSDTVHLIFRSNSNHTPTSLELAKILGGGGNTHSAGARIHLKTFYKIIMSSKG